MFTINPHRPLCALHYTALHYTTPQHNTTLYHITRHGAVCCQFIPARCPAGMDVLYKFRLPSADAQQVTVTLTPTQGDSDLYIKLGEGLRRF
jgi:hypothetical protein